MTEQTHTEAGELSELAKWLAHEQARFISSPCSNDPAVKAHIKQLDEWEIAVRLAAARPATSEAVAVAWRWRTRRYDNSNAWNFTGEFSPSLTEKCIEFEPLYAAPLSPNLTTLEEGQCPKCGAKVDERFDCCEVFEQQRSIDPVAVKALVDATQSLLDMSAACVRDDEVIENNRRREIARIALAQIRKEKT